MKKNRNIPLLGAAVDYLVTASPEMLQAFEMARLNEAANLKAQLVAAVERMVDATAEAILARTLIEQGKKIRQSANRSTPATSAELLADLLAPVKRLGNGKEKT